MEYLLIGISSHLAFWLLRSRVGVLYRLGTESVGLVDGMLAPGDDDEKLEALEVQTGRVLAVFLLFIFWVTVAVCVMVLLPWAHGWVRSEPLDGGAFFSWQGIVALSIGGTLGVFFPQGKPQAGAYSPMNQWLHRVALDNPNLHRWLHHREVRKWRKRGGLPASKFVLVTGLARAGTTSLMQRLLETGAFSSLQYGNMPFVLAPGTWRRVFNPKAGELKERSHGDGILVGATSAEALEEPFFRMATQSGYIGENALVPHGVDASLHGAYLDYQGLVREDGKVYLAKNNNALLRYPSLRKHNRDFAVVLMFRQPLAHAASLLAMHRRYTKMQQEDPFVWTYMDWLAHHEFGLGHRPFHFVEADRTSTTPQPEMDSIDYWLDRWLDYYEYALTVDAHGVLFVAHEAWSSQPRAVLSKVMELTGMTGNLPEMQAHQRTRESEQRASPQRMAAAEALYGRLMERALHLD